MMKFERFCKANGNHYINIHQSPDPVTIENETRGVICAKLSGSEGRKRLSLTKYLATDYTERLPRSYAPLLNSLYCVVWCTKMGSVLEFIAEEHLDDFLELL